MKRYRAVRPLRVAGRNISPGEIVWLAAPAAALALAEGLIRLVEVPVLLRGLPVALETKASESVN